MTFKDAEMVPKLLNVVDGFALLLLDVAPLLKFHFLLATVFPLGTADMSKNEILAPWHNDEFTIKSAVGAKPATAYSYRIFV
ncbi:MAG: hypothetical protein IPF58_07635 [Saprospirales bacterium]|nr:hypothetical protein [Saprospirales bacterium]